MTQITRRSALIAGLSCASVSGAACSPKKLGYNVAFNHGIASGDPQARGIVLWTRITPEQEGPLPVQWEVSEDKAFSKIVKKGNLTTNAQRDYTIKVDVQGLKPRHTYYYRFTAGDTVSPIGRTKTLPNDNVDQARLAIVSCSNFPFGYFNVYDHIAKNDGFDAVIHLGDYLYEYGRDGYGGKVGAKIGREHQPAHEIISLDDYRTRHAQYKADSASQALHAAHPMICIWDDHETANDSWKDGAQNHGASEGGWEARRAAAMQAYYEYMPVRDPAPGRAKEALFRAFEFGDLFSLISIETRLTARSKQIDYPDYIDKLQSPKGVQDFIENTLGDPKREMLSAAQNIYIKAALKTSKAKKHSWRIIANQVMMARQNAPDITDYAGQDFVKKIEKVRPGINDLIALSPLGLPINLDAWDGYPAARQRFYDMASGQGVSDLLVLTGDTHVSWANKLTDKNGKSMGVELGVTGVTSPGYNAYFKDGTEDYSARLRAKNPDIVWNQAAEHGYIDLQIGQDTARADFISVSTVYAPKYEAFTAKSFDVKKTDGTLKLEES